MRNQMSNTWPGVKRTRILITDADTDSDQNLLLKYRLQTATKYFSSYRQIQSLNPHTFKINSSRFIHRIETPQE
jgi:hypothetical protein